MNHRITFYGLCLLLCFACSRPEETACSEEVEDFTDTISIQEENIADTTFISAKSEKEENKKVIEQKYGKQWDFCDCVRKNDSINKVINNTPDNADFDPIFARMEEIDKHCKEMLTFPNTTPEERAKYEKKVKDCLKKH